MLKEILKKKLIREQQAAEEKKKLAAALGFIKKTAGWIKLEKHNIDGLMIANTLK